MLIEFESEQIIADAVPDNNYLWKNEQLIFVVTRDSCFVSCDSLFEVQQQETQNNVLICNINSRD